MTTRRHRRRHGRRRDGCSSIPTFFLMLPLILLLLWRRTITTAPPADDDGNDGGTRAMVVVVDAASPRFPPRPAVVLSHVAAAQRRRRSAWLLAPMPTTLALRGGGDQDDGDDAEGETIETVDGPSPPKKKRGGGARKKHKKRRRTESQPSVSPPPTYTPTLDAAVNSVSHAASIATRIVAVVLPVLIGSIRTVRNWYGTLPVDVATFLVGCIWTFFGGIYPSFFAAVQAAKQSGIATVSNAIGDLTDEAASILEASRLDDLVDDDDDGTADVLELDQRALMLRKTKLVLKEVNPQRVDEALASIYKVWMSVVAVLTVQFARTISLSLSISEFLRRPVKHVVSPVLERATPEEYKKWVPVVLGWFTKSIGISIAWRIQTTLSAATSALEGGLVMSRALLRILNNKGWARGRIPEKDTDTTFDEIASYLFAAAGVYFQFKVGFAMPFPFNMPLLPFQLAERYIRWTITKVSSNKVA